ncbi:mucin-2-like [Ornithodoros turicata]|uniref:mucin-2-like n=1 Tax=Ornithodoros turicata TaxID=34597 RepID=UPI0031398843
MSKPCRTALFVSYMLALVSCARSSITASNGTARPNTFPSLDGSHVVVEVNARDLFQFTTARNETQNPDPTNKNASTTSEGLTSVRDARSIEMDSILKATLTSERPVVLTQVTSEDSANNENETLASAIPVHGFYMVQPLIAFHSPNESIPSTVHQPAGTTSNPDVLLGRSPGDSVISEEAERGTGSSAMAMSLTTFRASPVMSTTAPPKAVDVRAFGEKLTTTRSTVAEEPRIKETSVSIGTATSLLNENVANVTSSLPDWSKSTALVQNATVRNLDEGITSASTEPQQNSTEAFNLASNGTTSVPLALELASPTLSTPADGIALRAGSVTPMDNITTVSKSDGVKVETTAGDERGSSAFKSQTKGSTTGTPTTEIASSPLHTQLNVAQTTSQDALQTSTQVLQHRPPTTTPVSKRSGPIPARPITVPGPEFVVPFLPQSSRAFDDVIGTEFIRKGACGKCQRQLRFCVQRCFDHHSCEAPHNTALTCPKIQVPCFPPFKTEKDQCESSADCEGLNNLCCLVGCTRKCVSGLVVPVGQY